MGSSLRGDIARSERSSISLGSGAMLEWERLAPPAIDPEEPEVNDHVRLTMSAEWRRDTRPPAGLERDDLTLKMGAALDFR